MSNKVDLGSNSKVRIDWHTLSMDYSHQREEEIISKFRKKYGLTKEQIKVNPISYVAGSDGSKEEFNNNITYNIQQPEFQHKLFKDYINEKNIVEYDFDSILEIDKLINEKIDYSLYEPNKHYFIKWIKWDNFMSYGSGNKFDFTDLNGLVLLSSEPSNQGGKTTFCLDLIRFLLFGKVTSRESDWTLSKVFNKYIPEATDVVVEGCIVIDGVDYVIKRRVNRPALSKRTPKSKVSQKVDYYKLINNEYIDLYDEECENGHGTKDTNKIIKDTIGNESDFDLMICVDSDNLKGLISLKDTERGKLISRWIGLIVLQKKDEIARKVYNEEISKTLTLSRYNKEDLKNDIEILENNIKDLSESNKVNEEKIINVSKNIEKYRKQRDELLQSKKIIDNSLFNVDVTTLENRKKSIVEEGQIKRAQLSENKKKLSEIKVGEFSLDGYNSLKSVEEKLNNAIIKGRVEYGTIENEIKLLKNGEYCPTCGAKLKDVDNSEKIKLKEEEKQKLIQDCTTQKKLKEEISDRIKELDKIKEENDKRDKLELIIAKNEVDINNLLSAYNEIVKTLKLIEDNKQFIQENNEIDIKIGVIDASLKTEIKIEDDLKRSIMANKITIENNNKDIVKFKNLIVKIESDEKLMNNWKLYLEMVGKNGISKLVVRTVLPQINIELKQLLSDVCDFDVEVSMDEHNDVEFLLIHDDVKSNLSSGSGFEQTVASLALRTVLSKISTFSKPSFVVFDEILGGVAAENYEPVKHLYDKILKQYQCILFITHNIAHKEWADRTITVRKKDNISSISLE